AQATSRQREFAVRVALGASRLRLTRQFIVENMLLTLAAGALGVLFSFWGVDLLLRLNQQSLPRTTEISVDARTLAFTLGLSVLVAIVLGLVPMLRLRSNIESDLKEGGRSQSGSKGQRARALLVTSQMALTMILLIGAGLLVKSFYRLLQVDPGFRTESAVAMDLSLPSIEFDEKQYRQFMESYGKLIDQGIAPDTTTPRTNPQEEKQRQFHEQLLQRAAHLPGVTAVGSINSLPLTGDA